MTESAASAASAVLERKDFQSLIDVLKEEGYGVVGPVIREGAILYSEIDSVDEIPEGWTDEQDGGRYRLKKRKDKALFGFVVGQNSWKQWFHPPHVVLWRARREDGGFAITDDETRPPKIALLGARSCELHAIAIQDKVFLEGPYPDPRYRDRREGAFVVAVNCVTVGGTCFCSSMNTGPRATAGFDLALTEIVEKNRHYFVVTAGSPRGEAVLEKIPHASASPEEVKAADSASKAAAKRMGRRLETRGLKEAIEESREDGSWNGIAEKCMDCANCTMVCPTCFCTTVEDVTDFAGENAERHRKWDSCFTLDFTYIHGGHSRRTGSARYRQWLSHKLSSWQDQFGTLGCVGCGRCITWCPVGIDLTEEVRSIRGNKKKS